MKQKEEGKDLENYQGGHGCMTPQGVQPCRGWGACVSR